MRRIGTALACAIICILLAAPASADFNVNVGIGLPVIIPPVFAIPVPPAVVVIPGMPVYYAPGLNVDIFFYGGYWWTPYQGHWFRSNCYNGPWAGVGHPPGVFVNMPGNYRQMVGKQKPIPYGQLKKHWREWEPHHAGPSPGWGGHGKHRH